MSRTALIAGVTGIVGINLAQQLLANGWQVHGLARRPANNIEGVNFIAADLLDPAALRSAVAGLKPTHLFLTTWLRQPTEAENIRINSAMVRNILGAVSHAKSVKHVALVTGLKHYLGPFEAYGKGKLPATPFREEQPRLDIENFYYAQEDELFASATHHLFNWTIHRPHTIVGYALGNAMNMGVTLAVYATICRETGRPFLFPGSATQWNSLTDMTDARLLARHLEWASTTPAARDHAFNVVNGDVFRWSWMWSRLADWFGIAPAPFPGHATPLEQQLAGTEEIWSTIAKSHNLIEPDLNNLASAWHTDADLGRPIEVVTDMTKSRKFGFLDYQPTDESFFDLFTRLRHDRIIP
ncbi:SDR family oxidoreductase [Tunturibacter empetritectus]|uniref:Nucleoside-diphosphate-sugar epimerase n=1 Tax=Tunturiibacter lichenicola TaxID=2051959 RepID=A0A7W8J7X3_9BACT|nr:SDR family oxidoreductase [Edaphobacter lichenicola]MBB5344288.1 nucleoside-diphosphate-sugar epimerase [Edaphobacter lichenicola]